MRFRIGGLLPARLSLLRSDGSEQEIGPVWDGEVILDPFEEEFRALERDVARREAMARCEREGHDWIDVTVMSTLPEELCTRCGARRWVE